MNGVFSVATIKRIDITLYDKIENINDLKGLFSEEGIFLKKLSKSHQKMKQTTLKYNKYTQLSANILISKDYKCLPNIICKKVFS